MTNPWVRCQFSAVIPSPSRSAFPSLIGIEHLGLEACQGPGSRQTSTDLGDTLSLPSFDHAWWWRRNAPSMSISILPVATNLPNLRHFHLQFDVESFTTNTTTSFPKPQWTSSIKHFFQTAQTSHLCDGSAFLRLCHRLGAIERSQGRKHLAASGWQPWKIATPTQSPRRKKDTTREVSF